MLKLIKYCSDLIYSLEQFLILPVIIKLFPPEKTVKSGDVLHVGYLSNKPRIICQALRKAGVNADFLAFTHRFSKSGWLKADDLGADFLISPWLPLSCLEFFGEIWRFYHLVLKYRVIHCHFLRFPSRSGWELPILKRLGIRIMIHYRGCDIRDPSIYRENVSIPFFACQECDYDQSYCQNPGKSARQILAREFGDEFLVTTPDLLDFFPEAEYFPFFSPEIDPEQVSPLKRAEDIITIVHATNHPGIDGTKYLVAAVEKLNAQGIEVDLNILKEIPYSEALRYYKGADLTVGKLLMGFYANSQLESMFLGTPTVCYIREGFEKYLEGLEIINANPDNLLEILTGLLRDRKELAGLGKRQQQQVSKLHDNQLLATKLIEKYGIERL